MKLRVWVFGVLVLRVERDDQGDDGPGDVTTQPVGFAPHAAQRYDQVPGGDVA